MRKGRRRGACAAPAGFAGLPAAVAGSVVPSGAAAQIPEQGVLDLEKGDIEDGWHTNSDRLASPVLVLEGHGTGEEAPGQESANQPSLSEPLPSVRSARQGCGCRKTSCGRLCSPK